MPVWGLRLHTVEMEGGRKDAFKWQHSGCSVEIEGRGTENRGQMWADSQRHDKGGAADQGGNHVIKKMVLGGEAEEVRSGGWRMFQS